MKTVIRKPLVTEKSSVQLEDNKVTFLVNPDVNKIEIKQFIELTYGVEVSAVNVLRVKPKKRVRGRIIGQTKLKKKAIVSLKPGENLDKIKALFG